MVTGIQGILSWITATIKSSLSLSHTHTRKSYIPLLSFRSGTINQFTTRPNTTDNYVHVSHIMQLETPEKPDRVDQRYRNDPVTSSTKSVADITGGGVTTVEISSEL